MNTAQFGSLVAMTASCFVVGYGWLALLWVAGVRRRWPRFTYGSAAVVAFLFGLLADRLQWRIDPLDRLAPWLAAALILWGAGSLFWPRAFYARWKLLLEWLGFALGAVPVVVVLVVGDPATRGLVALLALVGLALYVCLVKVRRLQARMDALETTVRRWTAFS